MKLISNPMSNHLPHDDYNHQDTHKHGNAFAIPFCLILAFAAVEFFGGIFTHSLALQGDAGYMFSDALRSVWRGMRRITLVNLAQKNTSVALAILS